MQDVLLDLEDYRRGALGNVQQLPGPWLDLLRTADREVEAWKGAQEVQLMERK